MKTVFISCVMSAFLFLSCGGTKADNHEKKDSKMATIPLTTAEFKTKVADLNENSQEWKYLGDKPAIIDFYASWCGPCRMVAPILEELDKFFGDQVVIGKLNVDDNPDSPEKYLIRNIPTILLFKDGKLADKVVGALPKPALQAKIEALL